MFSLIGIAILICKTVYAPWKQLAREHLGRCQDTVPRSCWDLLVLREEHTLWLRRPCEQASSVGSH